MPRTVHFDRVRAGDAAAQRRAKSIRAAADGADGSLLGDPLSLERSALSAWLNRPPPRPRGRVAIHESTDSAAILRRVFSEPVKRLLAEPMKEKFTERPNYARDRKRRWRAARRAVVG